MNQPKFKGKYRVESTRLSNWDYAANGRYFITICTKNRVYFFGDVVTGKVQLSAIGQIAQKFWLDIPNHFTHTNIDAYVIMPNHVHGIVVINRPENNVNLVETRHGASLRQPPQKTDRSNQFAPLKRGSLQAIINAYKSSVTRWCRQNGHDYFGWQPRFYDHIIRQDGSLNRIRQYIINNPSKWELERNNPTNLWI